VHKNREEKAVSDAFLESDREEEVRL